MTNYLAARAAEIQRQIDAAQEQIRQALLDGTDTAPVRKALAELAREADTVAAQQSSEEEEVAREAETQLTKTASTLVQAIAERLHARLAALEPPSAPVRS